MTTEIEKAKKEIINTVKEIMSDANVYGKTAETCIITGLQTALAKGIEVGEQRGCDCDKQMKFVAGEVIYHERERIRKEFFKEMGCGNKFKHRIESDDWYICGDGCLCESCDLGCFLEESINKVFGNKAGGKG